MSPMQGMENSLFQLFFFQQPNLKHHFHFPELLLPFNTVQIWKFKWEEGGGGGFESEGIFKIKMNDFSDSRLKHSTTHRCNIKIRYRY